MIKTRRKMDTQRHETDSEKKQSKINLWEKMRNTKRRRESHRDKRRTRLEKRVTPREKERGKKR